MYNKFESVYCRATVEKGKYDAQLVIKGQIKETVRDNTVYYIAATPPDYRATFTGSGLPFASQTQAFQGTPNIGQVQTNFGGEFEIKIMTPNAYYVGLGTVYVPPTLYLEYFDHQGKKKNVSIKLSDGIPYRTLTHPGATISGTNTGQARANAMFYATQFKLPVRSQEQILRDSAYPETNHMDQDFWGLKPPL
jgi:hypothetical protein